MAHWNACSMEFSKGPIRAEMIKNYELMMISLVCWWCGFCGLHCFRAVGLGAGLLILFFLCCGANLVLRINCMPKMGCFCLKANSGIHVVSPL